MIPWMGSQPPKGAEKIDLPQFDFGMTDLEERLRGPDAEEARADVVKRFAALDDRLKAYMNGGVAPQEFMCCRIIREALAHARKIVIAFK